MLAIVGLPATTEHQASEHVASYQDSTFRSSRPCVGSTEFQKVGTRELRPCRGATTRSRGKNHLAIIMDNYCCTWYIICPRSPRLCLAASSTGVELRMLCFVILRI